MKKLFIILILIVCFKANATNYYFSNTGNDANNGTSTNTPFKTIQRLNLLVLNAGDTIFFKSGDTFRGQINISASGNSSLPIVFTSYGTGSKPIISGAEIVTGFTLNGSKYEKTLTQKMNNFFVSDKEQTLARYPNNGRYLWLDSAQRTYLKDADLASLPANYINNSRVCVHTAQWCWEKSSVSSYNNAERLNYGSQMSLVAIANYGYFLYDNINLLDTANEWKFDSTTMLLTYMPSSGVNPNNVTCEASVYTNGINITGAASYISIINLHLEKQMNAGVATASTSNKYILIKDCNLNKQYNYGFYDRGKYNEVSSCSFRENDGFGVFVSGSGAGNCNIHHSTFRNIGQYRNGGIGTEVNLVAIKFAFVDSCYAHHNDIDSAGYCGISADGGYHLVEKNIIKNVMLLNNDGAALKSYGALSHHNTFRNNFVSTSDGSTEGTTNSNFITPAIYFDFNVYSCTIQDNTIYNRTQKGIFQNAGNVNNTIIGNNIYGANYGIDFNGHPNQNTADTMNGYVVKKNNIFLKTANDYIYRQVDFSNQYQVGYVDSNYYCQPYHATRFMQRPGAMPQAYPFSSWQSAGFDVNGKIYTFQWNSNVDSSQLFLNPTDNVVQQSLGGWVWKDLAGNLVTSLSLQPWTSKILLRTSTAMPVVFSNFYLENKKEYIACIWDVSLEVNTSHYVIERSTDGKSFEEIGTIKAGLSKYDFKDYNFQSLVNSGYLALNYRIVAVDYDGRKTYSTIQSIRFNNNTKILVYPNPATSYINIVAENKIASISLIDVNGKLLSQKNSINQTQTVLSVANISKGLIVAKVVDIQGNISFQKILLQ